MKNIKLLFLLTAFCIGSLVVNAEAKNDKHHHKHEEKHMKKVKHNGPPDHAPAHGYREKFEHYPDANIYHDLDKDVYYRYDNDKWVRTVEVPTDIDLGSGVSVDLNETIPAVIRSMN